CGRDLRFDGRRAADPQRARGKTRKIRLGGVEEHQTADGIIPDRVAVGDGNKSRAWRRPELFEKVVTSRSRRSRCACWFAFCLVVYAPLESKQSASADRA